MKPKHLSKHYGDQFQDQSVVDRYRKRPAYAAEVFDVLSAQLPTQAQLFDIGCGTGEIAIPLAQRGYQVTGVDPSRAMIEQAQLLSHRVTWQCAYAEAIEFPNSLDLIVTANSLHWMDWPVVFPKFSRALKSKHGQLAVITGGDLTAYAGEAEVMKLVAAYSTNQDFKPFSLVTLITEAGYFKIDHAITTQATALQQSVEDFIDSIHARNGFSIEIYLAIDAI